MYQFTWHKKYKGCLIQEDYEKIVNAMQILGNAIFLPSLGGITEKDEHGNKTEYRCIDFLHESQEIKEATELVLDFVNSLSNKQQ